VAEGVHRRQGAGRDGYGRAVRACLVEGRERRTAAFVARTLLRPPQRPGHVSLAERAARAGREHERGRARVTRDKLVAREDERQLARDRHRPGRAVGLGRPPVAFSVDLRGKCDLGIVEVIEAEVGPG
jgi:hypothetical protein